MFQRWRRKKVEKRAGNEERARAIFSYETRQGTRHCDPLLVAMALQTDPEYKPEHLVKAKQQDPVCLEIVANAAARAFQVKRLSSADDTGMTIAELLGLLDAFDLWCFQLQKKT